MLEDPRSELARLLREQCDAQQDEIFLGLLPEERAEYERRANRILELEIISLGSDAAARSQWNKDAETDTTQTEAHQPYRSREKDRSNAAADSSRSKGQNEPEGSEI
ncbi:MAG: hypothetical protein JWQ87_1849 [Candidatus Sulfotelmatobacter sp.]|nr:hypothetical protein [Candidatus Sulfotelmatobacter sp.]